MDITKIKTEPEELDSEEKITAGTKCGIIFRRTDHTYTFICEFCEDTFNGMVQFAFHLESKHFCNAENTIHLMETNVNSYLETSLKIKEEFEPGMNTTSVNSLSAQKEVITKLTEEEDYYEDIKQELLSDDTCSELSANQDESMLANDSNVASLGQGNYHCKLCARHFKVLRAFRKHMSLHKKIEDPDDCSIFKVVCEFCNIGFKIARMLRTHVVVKHKNRIPKIYQDDSTYLACERCNQSFETPVERYEHEQAHKTGDPYHCPMCPRTYGKLSRRDEHFVSHQSNNRPFTCDICGKGFKTKTVMRQHKLIHKEKSCKCEECGMLFRTRNNLRQHMNYHSDVRYKCEHCGKECVSARKLKLHMISHSDERPFKCLECPAAYKYAQILRKHQKTHARVQEPEPEEKKFQCQDCEMAFPTSEKLRRHTIKHGEKRPFKCSECDASFKYPASIKAHKKSHERQRKKEEKMETVNVIIG